MLVFILIERFQVKKLSSNFFVEKKAALPEWKSSFDLRKSRVGLLGVSNL